MTTFADDRPIRADEIAEGPGLPAQAVEIALPPVSEIEQDEEWVVVNTPAGWRRIRLHDYHEVYGVPGLYERWVYDVLECRSPAMVRELLGRALDEAGVDPSGLAFLDLGAGNGIVAEELREIGIGEFVGVDIVDEARMAAERDRPGLYDDYVIGDLTDLPEAAQQRLESRDFDGLACVAALGFGDIPPEVFTAALEHVAPDGWVAFTIKEDFLDDDDPSGFAGLVRSMVEAGTLEIVARERYMHRRAPDGTPLHYVAIVARRRTD